MNPRDAQAVAQAVDAQLATFRKDLDGELDKKLAAMLSPTAAASVVTLLADTVKRATAPLKARIAALEAKLAEGQK